MTTRAAVRREAALIDQPADEKPTISDLPASSPTIRSTGSTKVVLGLESGDKGCEARPMLDALSVAKPRHVVDGMPKSISAPHKNDVNGQLNILDDKVLLSFETPDNKISKNKKNNVVNGEVVKGGWDQLPHNMGAVAGVPGGTPDAAKNDSRFTQAKKRTSQTKKAAEDMVSVRHEENIDPNIVVKHEVPLGGPIENDAQVALKTRKRRTPQRTAQDAQKSTLVTHVNDEFSNDLKPTNTETNEVEQKRTSRPRIKKSGAASKRIRRLESEGSEFEDEKPKNKRVSRGSKKIGTSQGDQDQVEVLIGASESLQKIKKSKQNKYGITPGVSPYPDFSMPTAEACQEVNDILSEAHGIVEQPKTIPPPSLEVTGCGEVPSVLDALIRTRLSAATTGTNSAYAFAGLVSKFGILQEGIGKGSVNWNMVREADVKDIEQAIKRGGLAAMKSKSIKEILDMVHEQNIARREAFIKEKESGEKVNVVGAENLEQGQKDMEIAAVDQDILSLQFMHGLTPDEAMAELTKYPGIGVKTASCVILFCLRRPSFAVDTHVFRLCKWLKWIPENATRDRTFSHCEVRVPNELKYSLHQLFIRHGKTCGRCRASTGETSETWKETICPIEYLVERTGKRKMFKPAGLIKKERKEGKDDSDSELSELDEALFDEDGEDNELAPESEKIKDEK